MERDDEIAGFGNVYSTANRTYDSRIARWFSVDPARKKYLSKSPFNALGNNPIMYKDPGGDDIYVFNETYEVQKASKEVYKVINGDLTFDLPIPYKIIKAEGDHRYIWENGFDTGKDLRIHSPYTIHGGDGNENYMKENKISSNIRKLTSLNGFIRDELDDIIEQQSHCSVGTKLPTIHNYTIAILNFASESRGGHELDFKEKIPAMSPKKTTDGMGTLYEIGGTYYNKNEAGNFLFGYAAAKLGFGLGFVKIGGELYVDLERIKNGTGMEFDEPWEVAAVVKGYAFYKLKMLGEKNMNNSAYQEYLELYNNASNRIDYYEGNLETSDVEIVDTDENRGETDGEN